MSASFSRALRHSCLSSSRMSVSDAEVSDVDDDSVSSEPSSSLEPSFGDTYRFFAFSSTMPLSSSGLGSTSIFGRASTGAFTSMSPKTSLMMDAIRACCGSPQCTSAEMMMGYGDATKA